MTFAVTSARRDAGRNRHGELSGRDKWQRVPNLRYAYPPLFIL